MAQAPVMLDFREKKRTCHGGGGGTQIWFGQESAAQASFGNFGKTNPCLGILLWKMGLV